MSSPTTTATITVQIFSWLAASFGASNTGHFQTQMEVEAGITMKDLLNRMAAENHDFAEYVFDVGRQNLTGRVSVFFNDRILELVQGLDTRIQNGDSILFVPAYAGG